MKEICETCGEEIYSVTIKARIRALLASDTSSPVLLNVNQCACSTSVVRHDHKPDEVILEPYCERTGTMRYLERQARNAGTPNSCPYCGDFNGHYGQKCQYEPVNYVKPSQRN